MSTLPPPACLAERETIGLAARYRAVRELSHALCAPLEIEDYCIQSMPDVSPTKWHLAHTSWFFETFVLQASIPGYRPYDSAYGYLFNSYYESIGRQHPRPERGVLSRPTVAEVIAYRRHIDQQMLELLESPDPLSPSVRQVIETGLHHEQQHQELMLMDLKHVFWCNPLRPAYRSLHVAPSVETPPLAWHPVEAGLQWIGHAGPDFAYDNESPRHEQLLHPTQIASRLVTCSEYLEFIADGGYARPKLWLSDGWSTVQEHGWQAPLYWEQHDGGWRLFTLGGPRPINPSEPVCHVSYYEADAYARWAGATLPSEGAWEVTVAPLARDGNWMQSDYLHPRPLVSSGGAADDRAGDAARPQQMFGDVWEWTASPYRPYPGYRAPDGALGEYNGKFMCNQMVLRGGSCATPEGHIRSTYRNFFPPQAQWAFTGIRLAKDI